MPMCGPVRCDRSVLLAGLQGNSVPLLHSFLNSQLLLLNTRQKLPFTLHLPTTPGPTKTHIHPLSMQPGPSVAILALHLPQPQSHSEHNVCTAKPPLATAAMKYRNYARCSCRDDAPKPLAYIKPNS